MECITFPVTKGAETDWMHASLRAVCMTGTVRLQFRKDATAGKKAYIQPNGEYNLFQLHLGCDSTDLLGAIGNTGTVGTTA